MKNNIIKCKGFKFSGVAAGLKKNNHNDLGLIFSETEATAAGVFTKNRVRAAPVILDKERVKSGVAQAVIVNSGNANCCAGSRSMADSIAMARCAADELNISDERVLVASTGVIGQPLPVEKIAAAAPELIRSLKEDGIMDLATAIMTTDTVPKVVSRQACIDGVPFTVVAVAKGAGMIRPDMATMLCFVCTDLKVSSNVLARVLFPAVDQSFNRITIDGDTSTNDSVLLLANGRSGAEILTADHERLFQEVLNDLLFELAKMIVRDGEGATKLIEVVVKGALSDAYARSVAETVANSSLVKTAFFGEDANWGRIIAAVGRSGVPVEPDRIDIYFDDVMMAQNGVSCGQASEEPATRVLRKPEFTVTVDLNSGKGQATVFTCDFSVDYVKINADYRT